MTDFAGTLDQRIEHWQPTAARDALAGEGGDWTLAGLRWAAAEPIGHGPEVAGDAYRAATRWRLVMRPCDIAIGDRIARGLDMLAVRDVVADPATPDRVTVTAEATR